MAPQTMPDAPRTHPRAAIARQSQSSRPRALSVASASWRKASDESIEFDADLIESSSDKADSVCKAPAILKDALSLANSESNSLAI